MLDKSDCRILKTLRKNSRASAAEIARITGISPASAAARLAKLKKDLRFTCLIDFEKIGYPIRFWVICRDEDYQKISNTASTAYRLKDDRIMAECIFENNSQAHELLEGIKCEKIEIVEDIAKERFMTQ